MGDAEQQDAHHMHRGGEVVMSGDVQDTSTHVGSIGSRDVRNLVTIADARCYDRYLYGERCMRGFWGNMTHGVSDSHINGNRCIQLFASCDYFKDRMAITLTFKPNGEIGRVFGGWMDGNTLEVYHTVAGEWVNRLCDIQEVNE